MTDLYAITNNAASYASINGVDFADQANLSDIVDYIDCHQDNVTDLFVEDLDLDF